MKTFGPSPLRLAGLLLMSALVGCAALQAQQQQKDLARAVTECDVAFPAQVGNYVARAKCLNTAFDQIVRPTTRYPDHLNLVEAMDVAISTKVDRGEISPEDGNLQLQTAYSQIMDAERAQDARSATAVGILGAGLAKPQIPAATYYPLPRPPAEINCTSQLLGTQTITHCQ